MAREQELNVTADEVERSADFVRELRGGLSRGRESLRLRQPSRRLVEFEISLFELDVAVFERGRRLAHAAFEELILRVALGRHLAQAREHTVEAARETAYLVLGDARRFGREVARAGALHRAEHALDGAVDEVAEEYEQPRRDERDGERREPERAAPVVPRKGVVE